MDEVTKNKLNSMHADILDIKTELLTMNGRQREDHDRIARVEERVRLLAFAQAGLTLIASTIAGFLGVKQ